MIRLGTARGRGVLAATILGSGVAFLDGTVVNVALPTLGRELGAGLAGLQWTVDAYLLSLSALLLLGGSLGDRHGRRFIFNLGLAWFALASALCGFAPTIELLIAARALQGVGAALLVPGSLALLRSSFAEEDQAQAIGTWAGLSGVTTALGPLLGGWLISAVSWRFIFFLNLPLAALAIYFARRCVPESRNPAQGPLDLPGALTAALGLGGVVGALIEGRALGWTSAPILAAAALGLAGLAAFFLLEARREGQGRSPMLPLSLFRSRQFSGANGTTFALYFALGGATFFLALQLQTTAGYSPLQAGASLLPITLLLLAISGPAGKLAGRIGFRPLMTAGPLLAGLGLLLLGRVGPGASYVTAVLPGVTVLGLGLSLTVAPLTAAVISGAAPEHAGIASAVNNMVARLASLLAVALLPLLGAGDGLNPGLNLGLNPGLNPGFHRALIASATICGLGALCSHLTLQTPAARSMTKP